jgi:hypothetical protein
MSENKIFGQFAAEFPHGVKHGDVKEAVRQTLALLGAREVELYAGDDQPPPQSPPPTKP